MSAIDGAGAAGRSFDLPHDLTPAPAARHSPLAAPQLRGDATLEAVLDGAQTLARGSRGPAVRKLQEALNALGAGLVVDGAFGPRTEAALKDAQRRAGLPETGRVDAATIAAIDRRLLGIEDGPAPAPGAGAASSSYSGDLLWSEGPAIRPQPARVTTLRPQPPAAPPARPAPEAPVDYTNWFTDADALPVPSDLRRYLDQALRTGSHADIRALRFVDLALATPQEKARLLELMIQGATPAGDEEWMLQLLQQYEREGPAIARALAARGKLDDLVADIDGANRQRLLRLLPRFVDGPETAALLAGAVLAEDTRERRLGAHWIFDAARARGVLDPTLARLRQAHPTSRVVNDLIAQAKPTIKPLIVAHRGGDPIHHPENTIPAIRAGLEMGANAMEIDVTVTRDGRLVLWHDYDQSGVVAAMREAGMEPTMGYKPVLPPPGHAARRPIHELNYDAVIPNYGYARRDGNPFNADPRVEVPIPTLDEVVQLLRGNPQMEKIVLDVKLPPDRPDVHARFAQALTRTLAGSGLEDKVILMHNDARVVANLKQGTGGRYAATHDVEIVSLAPDARDYSAIGSARRLGNSWASVGRPRLGIDAYDTYLDVLRRDRTAANAAGRREKLMAWTINDELEMREIMAIGVEGIITDRPDLMARVVNAYWPR